MVKNGNKKIIFAVVGIIALIYLLGQGEVKKETNYWGDSLDDCLYADTYGRMARIAYYEENYPRGYFVSPCYEINSASSVCDSTLEGDEGYVVFFHVASKRSLLKDWELEALSCLEQYSTPETGGCDTNDMDNYVCSDNKIYLCGELAFDCSTYMASVISLKKEATFGEICDLKCDDIQDCDDLKITAFNKIVSWQGSPTSTNKNNALNAILAWAIC